MPILAEPVAVTRHRANRWIPWLWAAVTMVAFVLLLAPLVAPLRCHWANCEIEATSWIVDPTQEQARLGAERGMTVTIPLMPIRPGYTHSGAWQGSFGYDQWTVRVFNWIYRVRRVARPQARN